MCMTETHLRTGNVFTTPIANQTKDASKQQRSVMESAEGSVQCHCTEKSTGENVKEVCKSDVKMAESFGFEVEIKGSVCVG